MIEEKKDLLSEATKNLTEYEQAVRLVEKDPLNILKIPRKYVTLEMYEQAVVKNPDILHTLCIREYITPSNVVKFVNYNPFCISYVNEDFITPELAMFAVKKDPSVIKYIPNKALTDEVIIYVLNVNGKYLGDIPRERRNEKYCELAFSNNSRILRFIPEKFRTYEICKKSVISYPESIRFVPNAFLTEQFKNEVEAEGGKILSGYELRFVKNLKEQNVKDNERSVDVIIPEEVRNIPITDLVNYFSTSEFQTIQNIGIKTLGQLFDLSGIQELSSSDEIINTINLLKCKYLNVDPLIDINDKKSDIDYLYTMLGFSIRTYNALKRANFASSPNEFFSKIKSINVEKELKTVRNLGTKSIKEIVLKANIVLDYYEKKGIVLSCEKENTDETYDEMIETLMGELIKLNAEKNKIEEQINYILGVIESQKSSKGVTSKCAKR